MAARRSGPWGLLLAAFLVLPLIEIYLLVQVGQVIGAGWTILLLVLDSIVGIWLVRREGTRALADLQRTLAAGRPPTRELADGALLLIGATLLVTPGFLTDAIGLALVLPPTRALFRSALAARLATRIGAPGAFGPPSGATRDPRSGAYGPGFPPPGFPRPGFHPPEHPRGDAGPGDVVPGRVVDSSDDGPEDGTGRPTA